MKTACTITAMLGALGCIEAFILPSSHMPVRQKTARSAERINEKIELEKPKVRACFGVLLQRKAGVDLATDVAKGFNSCALYRQGRAVLKGCKVVTMDSVEAGSKKVYCRCWLSETFPLCDGTHAKHNEATGDNVGPLIVSGPK